MGHVRELAREHTAGAVDMLVTVMKNAKAPPAARVAAANALLDRGYGRSGPATIQQFQLPKMSSAKDAVAAMATITASLARGDLTTIEAGELARLVEAYAKTIEVTEIETRLQVLEEQARELTR
jgi:hypothetical protein